MATKPSKVKVEARLESQLRAKANELKNTTEESVLDFIFDTQHSRQCSCGGSYSLKMGRRQYQCSKCRFQIAPTANTLFHKSDTPLTLWLKAILTFSNAKSGISAKEMERQIEVTYKTAWRMLHLIRKALGQSGKLQGDVEMDTAYFGDWKWIDGVMEKKQEYYKVDIVNCIAFFKGDLEIPLHIKINQITGEVVEKTMGKVQDVKGIKEWLQGENKLYNPNINPYAKTI